MTQKTEITEEWLPGDVRDRIRDLCRRKGIVLSTLTEQVDMGNSRLSRFLNNETGRLNHEDVVRIARYFDVSTDFLLGETEEPDRKYYGIGELGLTVSAAKKLYTGEADGKTLSRLIEHESSGELLKQIGVFLEGSLSGGIAAQNQLMTSLQEMLCAQRTLCPEDGAAVAELLPRLDAVKQPAEAAEAGNITRSFSKMLRDLWKNHKERTERSKQATLLTRQVMKDMLSGLSKGKQGENIKRITPEALASAVVRCFPAGEVEAQPDSEITQAKQQIQEGLVRYFKATKAKKEPADDQ